MTVIIVAIFALVAAALTTWLVLRYAVRRGVIDIPNERSSHGVPTPRGGGMAIVAALLVGALALFVLDLLPPRLMAAIVAAGGITAAVGFWDDHTALPARFRFAAHFIAAALGLALLGGMPAVSVVDHFSLSGWPGQVFGMLMLMWMLNLYNFMDGIDGLAATEAVTVALGGALVSWTAGHETGAFVCLVLAAAAAGFLIWNFPPARIFMGDVGSGFLGIVFGVLAIDGATHSSQLLWCWLILLGAFIVDASLTLLRRLVEGRRVYEAHRSHAYQRSARTMGSHRPITLAVGLINVAWLSPLAVLVAASKMDGELALAIAWLPLVLLAIRWKAGVPDKSGA